METRSDSPPPPVPPGDDIAEGDLARLCGVSREDLKKLRAQLVPGDEWTGGAGRPVMITPRGVTALQTLLAEKKTAEGADGGTDLAGAVEAAQKPDRYQVLECVKVVNPRMLLARKKDAAAAEDPPARVLVRESKNFRPGMELEKCEPAGPGVFAYHGRLPRSFGRF